MPVEIPQIHATARPPSRDEAFDSIVPHLVEKLKTLNVASRLVRLSDSAFQNCHLMNLPVVAAEEAVTENLNAPTRLDVAAYAIRICRMGFHNSVLNPRVLRLVAVCQMNVGVHRLKRVVHRPTHDVHTSRVSE